MGCECESELVERDWEIENLSTESERMRERAESAEAAIERVRALHRNGGSSQGRTDEGYGYIKNCCETCGEFGEYGVEWPCPTIAALDKEEEK